MECVVARRILPKPRTISQAQASTRASNTRDAHEARELQEKERERGEKTPAAKLSTYFPSSKTGYVETDLAARSSLLTESDREVVGAEEMVSVGWHGTLSAHQCVVDGP